MEKTGAYLRVGINTGEGTDGRRGRSNRGGTWQKGIWFRHQGIRWRGGKNCCKGGLAAPPGAGPLFKRLAAKRKG